VQQQLASAPVHYAPSAAVPQQSFSATRASVNAPVARPTLATTHGYALATPAANPAHPQTAEARTATNPTRSEYQPLPYNSPTAYNHSQQSAPKPSAAQQTKPQKPPKAPKEDKPKK
jgi:hypothetical protein